MLHFPLVSYPLILWNWHASIQCVVFAKPLFDRHSQLLVVSTSWNWDLKNETLMKRKFVLHTRKTYKIKDFGCPSYLACGGRVCHGNRLEIFH